MHYLPLEKMEKLDTDVVDETPGAFLPSKILELAIKVFRHGLDQVLSSLCVLCWCSEEEIKRFEDEFRNKLDTSFTKEKERAYWSQDDLYKKNDKAKLQSLCKKNGISSDGIKHECVKRLVKKLNRNPPPVLEKYDGKLFSLPNYVTQIAKFSVYKLREILRFHNILDCGTKDELAIRVGTLRAGRTHLVFQNEIHAIQDIINATKTLIRRQKEHHLTDPVVIHRIRKFLTPTTASLNMIRPRDSASASAKQNGKRLEVPEEVTLETLDEVFRPIEDELLVYIGVDSVENAPEIVAGLLDAIRTVGVRILARWSKEEIGDSGWKTGWYVGSVLKHNKERDTIEVEFDTEANVIYTYKVDEDVKANKIRLAQSTKRSIQNYEEVCQVGVVVEVMLEEDELEDTDWTSGWYTAEVQAVDYDDDEVDLFFLDKPDFVYNIPVLPNLITGKLRLKEKLF
ncbi:Hypothetical predicted protein [Paramuricea clavata]|uniref:Uncharacterized protein n=1 Tax=Paramuricea clavata TaxID=317549 RepID=A0A6S7K640_PARCT|nr:Hypothetical predicted protein [Paramuricea clavata]